MRQPDRMRRSSLDGPSHDRRGQCGHLRHAAGLLPDRGRYRAVLRLHLHAPHRGQLRVRLRRAEGRRGDRGLGLLPPHEAAAREARAGDQRRFARRCPLGASEKREAWVALSVRDRSDVVTGSGRVLLAGEAGGFMSPTSGEGISYALTSGRAAGEAVATHDPDAALSAYAAAIRPASQRHLSPVALAPVHGVARGQVPRRVRSHPDRLEGDRGALARSVPIRPHPAMPRRDRVS